MRAGGEHMGFPFGPNGNVVKLLTAVPVMVMAGQDRQGLRHM